MHHLGPNFNPSYRENPDHEPPILLRPVRLPTAVEMAPTLPDTDPSTPTGDVAVGHNDCRTAGPNRTWLMMQLNDIYDAPESSDSDDAGWGPAQRPRRHRRQWPPSRRQTATTRWGPDQQPSTPRPEEPTPEQQWRAPSTRPYVSETSEHYQTYEERMSDPMNEVD